MKTWITVFLGGGLGSLARFGLHHLNALFPIPAGTLLANLAGSFIVGYLAEIASRLTTPLTEAQLTGIIVGFCGGFTTFSSFSYENYLLLKSGEYFLFISYFIGTAVLGIFFVFLGITAARFF